MMSRYTTLVVMAVLTLALPVSAQEAITSTINRTGAGITQDQTPRKTRFVLPKKAEVNYSAISKDFAPALMVREMPKQGGSKMEKYPETSTGYTGRKAGSKAPLLPLVKGENFLANSFGVSTPNDNDVAISDSGFVVSVINTNIFIRNIATQMNSPMKSLAAFTQPINGLHHEFDPKVMYDPEADRFILVCMVGNVDTNSKIIVGFSQGSDPTAGWNLYELPGDPLLNNLWSDYPMIALSKKELFLSVNLLYNDSSWQTGFVETVIWQMSKDSGYAGNTLLSDLHSNIKLNGKALRNLCPVKGGSKLYGPHMYFLSNRNLASQNDSVFLVKLTDTIGAPGGTITVKALKSNLAYRFPPDGAQKGTSDVLATNDCRNLGAFYENDLIQYVHNTKHPVNNKVTVHYGVIHQPESSSPPVTGFLVDNDTLDFAYPNISYAGKDPTDNSSIITFNHSSASVYPGCSAIQADGYGTFSPVLKIKDGLNYVNVLISGVERWGDYSGSQRRYNKPGEVWMSGYYGYPHGSSFPKAHAAWVAQIATDAGIFVNSPERMEEKRDMTVFPNPMQDFFSIDLSVTSPEYLTFEVIDMSGRRITLMRDWVKASKTTFSFSGRDLARGTYIISVTGNKGTKLTKQIVVN